MYMTEMYFKMHILNCMTYFNRSTTTFIKNICDTMSVKYPLEFKLVSNTMNIS